MNPDTMEFKATMFLPNTTTGFGQLCPDQRRMPQLGSLVAEAVVMPILLLRLPIVIVVASPVMVQLLAGPCYLDTKSHSLLMSCGQEIFSLEDFFSSAYACNLYFWNILAVVGNFMQPGFAQTVLNGMAAVGENSGASAFMPGVIGAFSKISANNPTRPLTDMQDLVSGRAGLLISTTMNPIAGAHWIWRMGSGVIVQIIQAVEGKRSVASVFWNVLYNGRQDYADLVAKRMFNTCGGLALMAGGSSPLAQMTLHYCFAGVKNSVAMLDLLSVFTVDLPLIVCVCRLAAGNNQADWILHNCESPDGLKPLLRTLIDSPDSCADLVAQTNANLTGVFNDTFAELFAGTTYVSSLLDSMLVAVDGTNAGQCDNFDSNPYVVTLIPEPADYWRVCGNTDFCKLRCQQQMDAFYAVQPRSIRSTTSTQTVQSLFFPTLNTDAYNPLSSVDALSELDSCAGLCPHSEDRCFLITGFVGTRGLLRVAQYCVPSALAQGVSKGSQWDTYGIDGESVSIQFIRVAIKNGWQDAYGVVAMQSQAVQVCLRLSCAQFSPSDVDVGVISFENMQTVDTVAVFYVRTASTGASSYCLSFQTASGTTGQWAFYPCPDTNIWDQDLYYLVRSSTTGAMLLLPFDNVPMQICQITMDTMMIDQCTQYSGFERQNVPVKTRGIQSRVSQSMSVDYSVFIASNLASSWLTMLRVSTLSTHATSFVGNSMPVTMQYTLQQGCSLDSCTGCTQLPVQRLCFAAQQCQIARCVGAPVNQLRPLCALGGMVESQFFTLLASMQGVWGIISSMLVTVLDATGGITPPKTIAWPDQAFYGVVCSMKDTLASQVSILTSAINGIVQAAMPVTLQAHGDAADNKFLATFTLTMTAVTHFLFQLTLAPLYGAIACQKIIVCQTNSLIGAISGNNAITIGDPSIQSASSSAAGVCMSQVHTENAQSLNNGMDTGQAMASGSTQVLSRLGELALTIPLDNFIHPTDVFFTYVLGVVMGLQDVLETADQKK